MKIERVDDNTVKCFLSNEELEEYEIDYKDFITRTDKAREVVHEIIEEAMRAVGFRPPKFAFDMQIMMMPEQGLVLTLSEKDPLDMSNKEQILSYLKELRDIFMHAKEKLGGADISLPENGSLPRQMEQEAPTTPRGSEWSGSNFAIFRFAKLSDLLGYAAVIPANLRVKSVLYRMDQEYFLEVEKGTASYARFSRACVQALEFGALHTAAENRTLHLREHGECLIAEGALKKLRF